MQAEGVVGYFDHRDVPGDNHIGAVAHDEEVTCSLLAENCADDLLHNDQRGRN